MPIRFVCEHCGQKLSVSSRVAGRKAKCPKCKEKIAIPEESEQPEKATSAVSEKSSGGDAEERASDSGEHLDENPFAQFAVYDDHNDDEWIYEEDLEIETPKDDRPLDPTKLAVSRRVLYMQGSLLGIVALGCFVFGIIVGFATAPRGDLDAGPVACVIRGKLAYQSAGNERVPDEGAVVIVVPKDSKPGQNDKVPIQSLRPEVTAPNDNDLALLRIRELGGDYTRANESGEYEIQVPDRGEYFVLFLSRNAQRADNEQAELSDVAQMGGYFLVPSQLLGSNCYEWRREVVRRDREITALF